VRDQRVGTDASALAAWTASASFNLQAARSRAALSAISASKSTRNHDLSVARTLSARTSSRAPKGPVSTSASVTW
jgi:hypothetical protein